MEIRRTYRSEAGYSSQIDIIARLGVTATGDFDLGLVSQAMYGKQCCTYESISEEFEIGDGAGSHGVFGTGTQDRVGVALGRPTPDQTSEGGDGCGMRGVSEESERGDGELGK
jgi:hypothetical protein